MTTKISKSNSLQTLTIDRHKIFKLKKFQIYLYLIEDFIIFLRIIYFFHYEM